MSKWVVSDSISNFKIKQCWWEFLFYAILLILVENFVFRFAFGEVLIRETHFFFSERMVYGIPLYCVF